MLQQVEPWDDLVLLTLSVDQNGSNGGRRWSSPREVWEFVRDNRVVSRLLREVIQADHWIAVLEFQKNGWPHWHILLPGRVDLEPIRAFVVDKWGVCGRRGVDVQGRWDAESQTMRPKAGAVRYATKYLANPDLLPDWVADVNAENFPVFFTQGRSVQSFSAWQAPEKKKEPSSSKRVPIESHTKKSGRRPIGVRISACGRCSDVAVHRETTVGEDGGLIFGESERCGTLRVAPDALQRIAKRARVSCKVDWFFLRPAFARRTDAGDVEWVCAKTGEVCPDNRNLRRVQGVWFTRESFIELLRRVPVLVDREKVSPEVEERPRYTLAGKVLKAFAFDRPEPPA